MANREVRITGQKRIQKRNQRGSSPQGAGRAALAFLGTSPEVLDGFHLIYSLDFPNHLCCGSDQFSPYLLRLLQVPFRRVLPSSCLLQLLFLWLAGSHTPPLAPPKSPLLWLLLSTFVPGRALMGGGTGNLLPGRTEGNSCHHTGISPCQRCSLWCYSEVVQIKSGPKDRVAISASQPISRQA